MYLVAPWDYNSDNTRIRKYSHMEVEVFTNGYYDDFDDQWFLDIGASILAMHLINALSPIIDFVYNWIVRVIRRCID